MKKMGFIVIVVIVLLSVPLPARAQSPITVYHADDLSSIAITQNTTTKAYQVSNGDILDIGFAPAKGDGWTFSADTNSIHGSYFVTSNPAHSWDVVEIYVDGELVKTIDEKCDATMDQCNFIDARFFYVSVTRGPHEFRIVNAGTSGFPVNLYQISYDDLTKPHALPIYLPMVIH